MNALGKAADWTVVRREVLTSGAELAAVAPAWNRLLDETGGSVFQSYGWVSAWWDTLKRPAEGALRIGLLWHGERLVAVLPLTISRRKGLKILEWAAIGTTDYPDILASADCSDSDLLRLWTDVKALGGYDIVQLHRLLPEARARTLLADTALKPDGRDEVSYRVAGTWDSGVAWFDGQAKKTRQNDRRGRKFLQESGLVQFRLAPADEPLDGLLERFAELKRKWMAERGHQSDLFDGENEALARTVHVLQHAGLLRIFTLSCGEAVVAISINFEQNGAMMALLTTYDPAFERASPGVLLMVDYVQWSIDHGLAMVDFLCGAEPFKLRFATEGKPLQGFSAVRTPLGHLARWVDKQRRAIKARRAQQPEADAAVS